MVLSVVNVIESPSIRMRCFDCCLLYSGNLVSYCKYACRGKTCLKISKVNGLALFLAYIYKFVHYRTLKRNVSFLFTAVLGANWQK